MVDAIAYASGSVLAAHEIVEKIKAVLLKRNIVLDGFSVLFLSGVINFFLAIGWAYFDGAPLNVIFIRALAQVVASSVWHAITSPTK